jgi:hypothetical protein
MLNLAGPQSPAAPIACLASHREEKSVPYTEIAFTLQRGMGSTQALRKRADLIVQLFCLCGQFANSICAVRSPLWSLLRPRGREQDPRNRRPLEAPEPSRD